jgi:hypothetical protein
MGNIRLYDLIMVISASYPLEKHLYKAPTIPNDMTTDVERMTQKKAFEEEIRDGVNFIEVEAFVSGTDKYALPDMVDIKVKGMFPSQARKLVKFLKEGL